MDGEYFDGLEEAASALGCTHQTLSNWINSGRLPAQRRFGAGRGGGSWRVSKKDLIAAAKSTSKFSASARWLELNGGAPQPVIAAPAADEAVEQNGVGYDSFAGLESAYIEAVRKKLRGVGGVDSDSEANYEIARTAILRLRDGVNLSRLSNFAANRARMSS